MALGLDPGGRARFAKLLMAIIDELTQSYRDLLQQQVSSLQIFNKVKASHDIFGRLNNDQILILNDANTKGYTDFDITLMYTLLRNICTNIPSPTKGWGTSDFPETGEVGIGDDIERIRLVRNKVYGHAKSASISKKLFEEYWNMISDICQRLQSQTGGSYSSNLQNILEGTIDEEQEEQYIKKMKADSEIDKLMLEKLSSLELDVKELKSRSAFYKKRPYRSTVKVIVRPKINSTKAKRKVARSMDILKRALNRMVEFIDEETEEADICQIEDSIAAFLESSSNKRAIIFIDQLLETFQNKMEVAFEQRKKVRMAIMKRFCSFVMFIREEYKAKFKVDVGSLLIIFYFESSQGFQKFTEDLRNGVIQEEVKKVVQCELFLWMFKMKKYDIIVELEECTDVETDNIQTEETRTSAKTCTECHRMTNTMCHKCGFGFCEKCWITHSHDPEVGNIQQSPTVSSPVHCNIHKNNSSTKLCKTCDTYICELCSTESHFLHDTINLTKTYQPAEADTKAIQTAISDIYESIYSNMIKKREELPKKYKLLKDKIEQEGQKWHDRVDYAVEMHIDRLENLQNQHLKTLEKSIQKMKDALDDISKIVSMKEDTLSKGSVEDIHFELDMERFKIIPEWSDFTFPVFKPLDVKEDIVFEMMGDLTPGVQQEIKELKLYPQTLELPVRKVQQLIGNPIVFQNLPSGLSGLRSIALDLEGQVWSSGYYYDAPSLFILSTVDKKEKPRKLETFPLDKFIFDMCFNAEGDLVFSDCAEGSVNIWKNDQVTEVAKFHNWTPMGVCATKEEIFFCMFDTYTCGKKVVRNRGDLVEHFEHDQNGEPLFSDEDETLYIAVNMNSDLCVSDYGANKVVVLNKTGQLRFTCTSAEEFVDPEPFGPRGITTDTMSRILVADSNNHCIHILGHDGELLSLIRNSEMRVPWTLDIIGDKVVIGNYNDGNILVLKYLV